ncbi:hypothetical protein EJP82_26260 [Paenibacillus anaericanus]|uniref:Uncharacterized protein n=1 Tax=Paenibacillus anaericanus TaxID=170367 RepID=A0A3S1BF74_9BACL|nr:hypothetical protein [Paenibacillus anaericanus]RUT39405.1 hypothetical protein EJP82_26260 [Paenibacillus anaericanus]
MKNVKVDIDMISKKEGISVSSSNFKDYTQLIESIVGKTELKTSFEKACGQFNLEPDAIGDFIIKYVIHQLKMEFTTFSIGEKRTIGNFAETKAGDFMFDILEKTHFADPERFFGMYNNSIRGHFSLKEIIEGAKLIPKLFKNYEPSANDPHIRDTWLEYSNKLGSFYRLYNECEVIRAKKPISTAPNNLDEKKGKDLIQSQIHHITKYFQMLKEFKGHDITEDLLELERNTDLFFLHRVYQILKGSEWFNKLSKDRQKDYLKVISLFSVIDDLNIKLYMVERFVEDRPPLNLLKGTQGYVNLFRFIYFQIPTLKELLKRIILNVSEEKVGPHKRGRDVILKMHSYLFLEGFQYYQVPESDKELLFGLNIHEISSAEYSELYFDLYKCVYKLRKIRGYNLDESIFGFINKVINKVILQEGEAKETLLNDWEYSIDSLIYQVIGELDKVGGFFWIDKDIKEYVEINELLEVTGFFGRINRESIEKKLTDSNIELGGGGELGKFRNLGQNQ